MRFFSCKWKARHALFLTLLLSGAALSMAQSPEGTITGTVMDAGGARIVGAHIIATNRDTGLTYTANSAVDGVFVVPLLPPGKYSVSGSASGFEKFQQDNLNLDVAQRLGLDIHLVVGKETMTVTVTDTPPILQSEQSSLGNIIDQQEIQDLPTDGRQPFTLALLVPGVRPTNTSADGFADASNQAFSRIQINGGSTLGNQFFLDGAMDTVPAINEVSVVPMADSITQFRVSTNSLEAEYGQTSGGIVNLATKSGTNHIHGTAYEFVRNDALNAENYFAQPNPITGRKNPVLHYNQYGGTIGGPIKIPKLYDGRDRTFFFFGYEQWYDVGSNPQYSTVPTAAERSGDFSGLVDSTGKQIKIYNPSTTALVPGSTSTYTRQQFPNNMIASGFDSLALKVLQYMPLPNITPSSAANLLTNTDNYLSEQASPIKQDVIAIRVDQKISNKDFIFARYAGNINQTTNLGYGLGAVDSQARDDHRVNHNLALGETHTFSPTVLNEFRISGTRQFLTYKAPSVGGNWPAQLGYNPILPPDEFPAIQMSGYLDLGYSVASSPSEGDRVQTTIQIANSTTVIRGRNTIKFGVDHRITRLNYFSQTYPSGEFTFTSTLTALPSSPSGTGNAFASYLLGQVGGGQQTSAPAFAFETWSEGSYIQDDFKFTPSLTLNMGLRYDVSGPPTERHNYYSNFEPYTTNPVTGTPGALLYAGVNHPRNFVDLYLHNLQPRFGFAYSVNRKTVVRGGFALVYNSVESADIHGNAPNSLGFSSTTTFSTSGNNNAFLFAQGPSALVKPLGAAGGPGAYRGQSVNYQDFYAPVPYDEQFNLTVQREVAHGWTATASYAGNHGVHLIGANYNANQLNPAYFAQYGTALQALVPNPYYGQITTGSLSGKTITKEQALLPFPDYITIQTIARHGAGSNYNSLQASTEHRSQHGYTLLFAYVKAKLLDDSSNNDSGESVDGAFRYGLYNPHVDYSLDANDISQRIVGSGVWKLPFFPHRSGWVKEVFGDYQVNGTTFWQTGVPLAVTGSNNLTGINYPNLVGNPTLPRAQRSIHGWFNTAAFVNPPNYVVGDSPRTLPATRGPNYVDTNFSLFKYFTYRDSWVLQLRAEAFNLFNHPNFSNPNTSFVSNASGANGSASFGTITSANNGRAIQLAAHLQW
jgi:hypothetical protein